MIRLFKNRLAKYMRHSQRNISKNPIKKLFSIFALRKKNLFGHFNMHSLGRFLPKFFFASQSTLVSCLMFHNENRVKGSKKKEGWGKKYFFGKEEYYIIHSLCARMDLGFLPKGRDMNLDLIRNGFKFFF